MEDLGANSRMHKVSMTNRRLCVINGVKDVLSFDIQEVRLETELGMLQIVSGVCIYVVILLISGIVTSKIIRNHTSMDILRDAKA